MNLDKEKMWQAYLDGELSTSEISAFEGQLTDEEREGLAGEMRFERGLAEVLSRDAECPELLWRRVQSDISRRGGFVQRYRRAAAMLAAAAVIAFVATAYGPTVLRSLPGGDELSPAVVMAAQSVEALQATSMTDPNAEAAQHFLREHGIPLGVEPVEDLPMAAVHHDITIVGARKDRADNGEAFEILFGCCGFPVKVVMAEKGTAAAAAIGRAAGSSGSDVQAMREIGGYITAVVGKNKHRAHNLLDVFAGQGHM